MHQIIRKTAGYRKMHTSIQPAAIGFRLELAAARRLRSALCQSCFRIFLSSEDRVNKILSASVLLLVKNIIFSRENINSLSQESFLLIRDCCNVCHVRHPDSPAMKLGSSIARRVIQYRSDIIFLKSLHLRHRLRYCFIIFSAKLFNKQIHCFPNRCKAPPAERLIIG